MKKTTIGLAFLVLAVVTDPLTAQAQNTIVTYQGRLTDNGTNFTGAGLFKFALVTSTNTGSQNLFFTTFWSNDGTSANGSEPAAPVSVSVNNGLFTVALGDTNLSNMTVIPVSLFATPNMQLRIWFNDGVNGSAALSPVQNLTATPYAAVASSVNGGFSVQNNANDAPNVIAGSSINFVSPGIIGATIGGGGTTNFNEFGASNSVTGNFGTVSGGLLNSADLEGTVGGGGDNTATGEATVGGGGGNTASSYYATIGGGLFNTASGYAATIPGGFENVASLQYSFAAGAYAHALNNNSFVW